MQEQAADISLLSAEYYYLRKTFYKNKNNLYVLFALLMSEWVHMSWNIYYNTNYA